MKESTRLRLFFGFLILVGPAALYFVSAVAGWAVLALVAGTLVSRKRRSSLQRLGATVAGGRCFHAMNACGVSLSQPPRLSETRSPAVPAKVGEARL
jgi:hypothetical protein